MTTLSPHARPGKLAVIDGRRAEARRMKQIRAELVEHLGGHASATQSMMITRISMLLLRIELMDARALKKGDMTERDAHQYLAWNNAVSRMLRELGLKAAPKPARTIQDVLNDRAAERAGAAA